MAQFQNLTGGSNPPYYLGPADTSTAGGAYSNYNGHLNIDCNAPSQLVSALVYAEGRVGDHAVLDVSKRAEVVGERLPFFQMLHIMGIRD